MDHSAAITIEYSNNRVAQLYYTGHFTTPCDALIVGENGAIRVSDKEAIKVTI